jgi:hypothetical protein
VTAENKTAMNGKQIKTGGQKSPNRQPRAITHPNDVANLVMMRIDNVNGKKDELTIAIKSLTDTSKQLVRAYAQQMAAIAKLTKRVQELEARAGVRREE